MKVRKKNKESNCLLCGKEFKHFKWDKQIYCSNICAYRRVKIEVKCTRCRKIIFKSKSLYNRNEENYCSRECYDDRRKDTLKNLKRHTKYYNTLLDNSSCECGESKKYLLQIHHIDGNHNNNEPKNLEIVCANCHVKRHLKLNKKGELVYHPKSLTNREILKSL